ncbi:MAG TPA: helix-turn-helix transcriptional regulator [Anaeromyxobacteraceae bacterium]
MHDPAGGAVTAISNDTPLRSARRAAGLTQAALAALVGRTASWVSYTESRTFRLLPAMAERIAAALGVPVAMVLPGAPLAPDATFHCQRLHCRLSVACCLARQRRSWKSAPRGESSIKRGRGEFFPYCTERCALGAQISVATQHNVHPRDCRAFTSSARSRSGVPAPPAA